MEVVGWFESQKEAEAIARKLNGKVVRGVTVDELRRVGVVYYVLVK